MLPLRSNASTFEAEMMSGLFIVAMVVMMVVMMGGMAAGGAWQSFGDDGVIRATSSAGCD